MSLTITLSDGETTLLLDPDLWWSNEFDDAPVARATERSLTGALIVYSGLKVGGRSIMLKNPNDRAAWMTRAALEQVKAWEALPTAIFELDIRGRKFNVIYDCENGPAVSTSLATTFVADPVPGGKGDWYLVTLRFKEVA